MAKQTINIGTSANSKDGDIIRDAFNKVNQNFTELYAKDTTDFDGSYNSLTNTPTIPADVSDLTDTQGLIGQTDRLVSGENELVFGGEIDPAALTWPDGSWQSTAFVGDATRLYGNLDQDVDVIARSTPATVTATTTAGTDPFTGQFEISLGLDAVQAGWEMNTGTEQSPIWTTVSNAVLNPGEYWIYLASGFEFAPSTAYTFRNPTPVLRTWTFGTDGTLTLPATADGQLILSGSEIAGVNNNSVALSSNTSVVINTYDPSLHTWTFGNDGNLTLPNGTTLESSFNSPTDPVTALRLDSPEGGTAQLFLLVDTNQVLIDNNGVVITGGIGNSWEFGNAGLIFPDATVQTTAWAGGRVVAVPAHSTGAVGDLQGDLAFNSTHLYYCIADYNQLGHQVTGADYLGRASLNTNAFQLTKTADTIQITVGDIISDSDGGATSTVVTVSSDENYTYVSTGGLAYAGVFPFTFTSTDYVSGGNIWKRVAWGGDTW